jgi:hypothetical protein
VSIVTVSRSPDSLKLEIEPSPELLRALELDVYFAHPRTFMRAAVYLGRRLGASSGIHPLTAHPAFDHWQLRPGFLAALVVGLFSISITAEEFAELRQMLEPLGLEVIGRAAVEIEPSPWQRANSPESAHGSSSLPGGL